ncbi:MAG: cytochrome P460 family protein [Pseudomonadota bacterium]
MTKFLIALGLALGTTLAAPAVSAQALDCPTTTEPFDLTGEEISGLYDCIKDALAEGYAKGDNDVAAVYRTWSPTATRPAVAGPHGERLLNTFANDIGAEQYLKFQDDGAFVMPTGSVLAKESMRVNMKKGQLVRGPLFIMTKVGLEAEENSDGWFYSAVQPSGKAMKIKQSFCHDCHSAFSDSDSMGYPLEEVRIGADG